MKKTICLLLAVIMALTASVMTASASYGSFSDISDTETAQNVESLRMMGVLGGMGDGTFRPDSQLTRAQFCKMAVIITGKSELAAQYKSYTIFPDVRANYWAAEYINFAVRGETKMIAGFPDGTFGPDKTITFAQAVTILMRLLGYSDSDTGVVWPDGYISAANAAGLTDGISLGASDALSRKNAAKLFVNLLSTNVKGTQSAYASSVAGTVLDNTTVYSVTATADDGTKNAIETSNGTYKCNGITASSVLCGIRGKLLLTEDGAFMTVVPDKGAVSTTIVLASAKSDVLYDTNGNEHKIGSDVAVYIYGERSTYAESFKLLKTGCAVTICYNSSGSVQYLFVGEVSSSDAVVVSADNSQAGFSSLAGGNNYTIVKNGVKVDSSALKKYDVAVYDSAASTIRVCDSKLYACFENVYPNKELPATVTLMGKTFKVMQSAADSISKCSVGSKVTALLTEDNRIAGMYSGFDASSKNCYGIVSSVSGKDVSVDLLCGITVDGENTSNALNTEALNGQLVTVTSTKTGALTLAKVDSTRFSGVFDVKNRKIGSTPLAENVQIFEKVTTGPLQKISLGDITTSTVGASSISYTGFDYGGNISILVLSNVTGEGYIYGRLKISAQEIETNSNVYSVSAQNGSESTPSFVCGSNYSRYNNYYGGIAASATGKTAASIIVLNSIEGITSDDWTGKKTLTHKGVEYTISDSVKCYNKTGDVWITFEAARAYTDTMNVYYDKAPSDGGKIRIIEVW